MKKSIFRAAALSVAMIFAATNFVSAQATTAKTQIRTGLVPVVMNQCAGEMMNNVSGDAWINVHFTYTPSGNSTVTIHQSVSNAVYVGVNSGNVYHAQQNSTIKQQVTSTSGRYVNTGYLRFIGKGGAPDMKVKTVQVTTIDYTTNPPTIDAGPVEFIIDSCK